MAVEFMGRPYNTWEDVYRFGAPGGTGENPWVFPGGNYYPSIDENDPNSALYKGNAPQPAAGGGEGEGEGGEGGIDLSGLEGLKSFSKSSASQGLPDWGSSWAQDWLNTLQPAKQGIMDSLTQLKNAPGTIEQTRQNMINQYRNAMDLNLQDTLRPTISNLSGRGVLSSSTAEGSIGKVLRDLQAKKSDQVENANVWAGNSLLENIYKTVAAYQGMGNLMNALLNVSRVGSSESYSEDPVGIYSTLLPLLLGGLG